MLGACGVEDPNSTAITSFEGLLVCRHPILTRSEQALEQILRIEQFVWSLLSHISIEETRLAGSQPPTSGNHN
jgi:hypothetical protein